MYTGHVLGACTSVTAGCIVLPNTGGNIALTIAALTSITVGGAILLSTAIRLIAKKMYKV
jgi:hypothetical protein